MNDLLSYVVLGTSKGLVYGLLAMGMVLVYKGTRVLNLAHPFLGLVGAFFAWWLTSRAAFLPFAPDSRPRFLVAAVLALALVGLMGFLLERDLFRRLRRAPRLLTLVLTIALAQGLLGLVVALFERNQDQAETLRIIPSVLRASFVIGDFGVTGAHVQVFVLVPLVALAGGLFFRYSRFGVAVRAAAENAESAQLLGVSVNRVSAFVWVAGAVLAALAGILLAAQQPPLTTTTLSIGFLVRALAAALVGGLTSIPGALVGGVLVGIAETTLQARVGGDIEQALLFGVVVVMLLVRPQGLFGEPDETEDRVAFVPAARDLTARLRASIFARFTARTAALTAVGFAVALSMVTGSGTNGVLVNVAVFSMVGVSLTVLMGFSGQVSLGHWALVGVGAFATANLTTRMGIPYALAVPWAVLIGMVVSLVIGLPALRIRGMYLAVVTLAFSYASEYYLFRSQLIGRGQSGILVDAPTWGPLALDDPSNRPLFLLALGLLLVTMAVARNLLRSNTGRRLLALRENEKAAETLGVRVTSVKLLAFAVSGGMAALAGSVYALRLGNVNAVEFPTQISLTLVAMVMIGGLGSLQGSVLGAFLVFGLPNLVQLDNRWIVPFATGALLLVVLVRLRGGLAALVHEAHRRIVTALVDLSEAERPRPAGDDPPKPTRAAPAAAEGNGAGSALRDGLRRVPARTPER